MRHLGNFKLFLFKKEMKCKSPPKLSYYSNWAWVQLVFQLLSESAIQQGRVSQPVEPLPSPWPCAPTAYLLAGTKVGRFCSLNSRTAISTPREKKKISISTTQTSIILSKRVGPGPCGLMGEIRQQDEPHESWTAKTTKNNVVCSVGLFGEISSLLWFVALEKQMAGTVESRVCNQKQTRRLEKISPRMSFSQSQSKHHFLSRPSPRCLPGAVTLLFFSSHHHYCCNQQSYGCILMSVLQ